MNIPDNRLYTEQHEWLQVDGDTARMGLTAYAVEQLGGITYVELPDIDREATQGDALCSVESVKAVSDIYAPCTGSVAEVNDALEGRPELIDEDPYAAWICAFNLASQSPPDNLMDAEAYRKHLDTL